MKLAFAGTPDFAVTILESLFAREKEFEVVRIFSQPARAKGRGLRFEPSPVETLARARGVPVETPTRWDAAATAALRESAAEILVTAAYGIILPRDARESTRLDAINVHASLLPRWRGAAPIQRAIESGDSTTGITIFRLDDGVDTGPVYAKRETPIGANENAEQLTDRLALLASKFLIETLRGIASGTLKAIPQTNDGATRAKKLKKEEGSLAWTDPAETILRKVRAFQPWPGVTIDGVRIVAASAWKGDGPPGTVLSVEPLVVASNGGAILLEFVQRSGGRPMTGDDYARGRRLAAGDRFA